jgi:chromodomain-helicase-DNA-binding protein 4
MARAKSIKSDEDEHDLLALFKKGATSQMRGQKARAPASGRDSSDQAKVHQPTKQAPRTLAAVRVPPVRNRGQYIYYDGQEAVRRVRREFEKSGESVYDIELVDGTHKQVSRSCTSS